MALIKKVPKPAAKPLKPKNTKPSLTKKFKKEVDKYKAKSYARRALKYNHQEKMEELRSRSGKVVGTAREIGKTASTLGGYSVASEMNEQNNTKRDNQAASQLAAWLSTNAKNPGSNQSGSTSEIESSALGG